MSFPRQIVRGRVYLVTRRCTQRQFLLRPDEETNNAFVYCMAYAAKCTSVGVVAFIANSNHYHAVVIDKEGCIPQFLEIFHKLLAKHQNALRGRWENLWATEQTSLVELIDAEDVFAKIVYTLTNPVKDHLVECAHHWPGASSRLANLNKTPLSARRPQRFFRADGAMPERLELLCVSAPGFERMEPTEFRDVLSKAIKEVETSAAAERRRTGRKVLGREAILAQRPTDSPGTLEPRRVLDPHIAARDKGPRIEAIKHLKGFRGEYFGSRKAWLHGEDVVFPHGTYWLKRFAGVACKPNPAESSNPLDSPPAAHHC